MTLEALLAGMLMAMEVAWTLANPEIFGLVEPDLT